MRLSRLISGKTIIIGLTCMVLAHLVAMVVYTQYSKHTQRELNRDQIIEQMINVIELIQSTPPKERENTIKALYYPFLQFNVSKKPTWQLEIKDGAFWKLEEKLHSSFSSLQASYLLPDNTWLNMEANVDSHAFEWQLILILFELVIVGALLFSAWSIDRYTGPLKQFKAAAERLGVDVRTQSIPEYGPIVVRETADAMNKMQTRILELVNNRTKMLAAISHDLRTPITRLRLRADYIKDTEQYEKSLNDLDEMEMMIDQILSFAQVEFQNEPMVKLDLSSQLTAICDDFNDMGKDVTYIGTEKRVTFTGRSLLLKRVFTNLMNNAVKYGNKVRVDLKQKGRKILITIEDDGPGIPDAEHDNVFDPFYRTDRARSSKTGGAGLGLSVAKDIIRDHGGSITLKNLARGGLAVIIELQKPN